MASGLKIATSQFPVSSEITSNARYIRRHMKKAANEGVDIIHFSETALSGYAGVHFESFGGYNWDLLEKYTHEICNNSKKLKIWTVLGSTRRSSGDLPKNCILVISNTGKIVGVYEKQRLYREEKLFYSQGHAPLIVEINGILCGFLICYDSCYPELYTTYRERGVRLLFHSFYNANSSRGENSLDDLIIAQLQTRSADNQMWISASNSTERYSRLASCIVRPDGSMTKLKRHKSGVVVNEFQTANLGWTYDNSIVR